MTITRRGFLKSTFGAGAGLTLAARGAHRAVAQTPASPIEHNKAVVLRYKKAQGSKDSESVFKEVLAPDYKRLRAGIEHLANNARDQGFPAPGRFLRDAIPDRVDVMEEIIAEGDKVGLRWRLTGTHRGNFYGIPPTGRKIDIYEVAIFRLAGGRITEGWFMADEAGLLKQLGALLPPRKDGKLIAPPVTNAGEDPDALMERLKGKLLATQEDRNRVVVASSKISAPPKGYRAPDYRQRRLGFQHLREYGNANGVGDQRPTTALPDRRDKIDELLAEGDQVWMQFKIAGTHTANLYGFPPTGKRVEVSEIGIARFVDGKWREGWYFGDELGLLLQLGALHMLKG